MSDDYGKIILGTAEEHIKNKYEFYGGSVISKNILLPTFTVEDIYEFKYRKISSCLYVCINELLSNSYDHTIRSKKTTYIIMNINTENSYIEFINNGDGINHDMIENAFMRAFTYSDTTGGSRNKKGISGYSGIGAKLTLYCSSKFIVESVKNKRLYTQKFLQRGEIVNKSDIIETNSEDYTRVIFYPSENVFDSINLTEYIDVFRARCLHIKWLTGDEIKIIFNGTDINLLHPCNLFTTTATEENSTYEYNYKNKEGDIFSIYMYINKAGISRKIPLTFAIINGMDASLFGGKKDILDILAINVKKIMSAKFNKSAAAAMYDNILANKLKDKLYILFVVHMSNPRWSSNIKNKIENPMDIHDMFVRINLYSDFINSTASWLTTITDKSNKSIMSKYHIPPIDPPPKNEERVLIISEGNSADSVVTASIAEVKKQNVFGRFILYGKPPNLLATQKDSANIVNSAFFKNEMIKCLMKAIGLKLGEKPLLKNMLYKKIVIMTDQDTDGDHIAGLIITFLSTAWPELTKMSILYKMCTPLVIIYDKKKKEYHFSSASEADKWIQDNKLTKAQQQNLSIRYFKGMGQYPKSWEEIFFKDFTYIKEIVFDEHSSANIKTFFDADYIDERRVIINNQYVSSRFSYFSADFININKYLLINMLYYFQQNNLRHLPSLYDGLNDSQRRVLHTIIPMERKKINMTSLAGIVKSVAAYEHGDTSLQKVIMTMAKSYDGHTYIPLILIISNAAGTRYAAKQEASARYLDCVPNSIIDYIFPKEDLAFLDYINGDIVPKTFYSTIPFILFNYNKQPASSWSVEIIPRDVNIVCNVVLDLITKNTLPNNAYIVPCFDYTPLRTHLLDSKDKITEIFYGCYELTENNRKIVISETAPYSYTNDITKTMQDSGLFSDVTNTSLKWNVNITGTIKYNKALESEKETLERVLKLLGNMLTYKFNPKLNFIVDAEKSTIQNFGDYLTPIIIWFEKRKNLYERIYNRNLKLISLQIEKYKEIKRFIDLSEQKKISIIKSAKITNDFLLSNKFKRISSNTVNSAKNYNNPAKLEHDWYNGDDANYNYILGETISALSSAKHIEILNRLEEKRNIMLADINPFKYAGKWRKNILKILEIYNSNVKFCWVKPD